MAKGPFFTFLFGMSITANVYLGSVGRSEDQRLSWTAGSEGWRLEQ